MSFTQVPDITALLAAIDAGVYKTPSARLTAIEQAGGHEFVQLQIIRQWLSASGGSGDVVGPASATNNAVARFDTTTGKLLQDSLVTIGDGGQILLSDGDATHPMLSFASDTGTGWYYGGAGRWIYAVSGVASIVVWGGDGVNFGANKLYLGAGSPLSGADITIERLLAGVLKIPGLATKGRTITASDTVDSVPGDYTIEGAHATVAITITGVAASANPWRHLSFFNSGAADVTVDFTGLGQIFTTALVNTLVLHTGDSVDLQSNGAFWKVK